MVEKLEFTFLGNGITIYDTNNIKNNDYVAHISYCRHIQYHAKLSQEARSIIEDYAKYENLSPTSQPYSHALEPLNGSGFMTIKEKENYLLNYSCPEDGISPFLQNTWDETKTPSENLELFLKWWNDGTVDEYL